MLCVHMQKWLKMDWLTRLCEDSGCLPQSVSWNGPRIVSILSAPLLLHHSCAHTHEKNIQQRTDHSLIWNLKEQRWPRLRQRRFRERKEKQTKPPKKNTLSLSPTGVSASGSSGGSWGIQSCWEEPSGRRAAPGQSRWCQRPGAPATLGYNSHASDR